MDSAKPSLLSRTWKALASLQLTIVALAVLMGLVLLCTLAQARMGVYAAVDMYMRTIFVWWKLPFLPFAIPIFPGGILAGLVLLANLVAGLIQRFRFGWNTSGLWITHLGLILLIAGEFYSGAVQVETRMSIEEGQTVNHLENPREFELVLIDTTNPARDQVYAIPARLLRTGESIQIPGTPITVNVVRAYPNAFLARQEANDPRPTATAGVGMEINVVEQPASPDPEENLPTALVEPVIGGNAHGIWLVSAGLGAPQTFPHEDRTFAIALRHKRTYLPYSLTLKDFRNDVYPGTDIPKNYSSLVQLKNPITKENREVLIRMNQPLRYEGLTFYQASFGNEGKLSVLQVVRNPGWTLPYVSCTLISLGLLVHFGITLRRSRPQRRTA